MLKQDLPYLQEINISGNNLSDRSMQYLTSSLRSTNYIIKLTISHAEISYNSLESLVSYVSSSSLEYLDLSSNSFSDSFSEILCPLFTSKLKILILDRNCLEDSVFSTELACNKDLLHFSLSYNPLKYSSVISLLESLPENNSLQYLGLLGIKFKGAAPIKENCSGLLDAQVGIILKLSYILRSSNITSIGLDISPVFTLQLKELENTMIKHNKALQGIDSKYIDWNNLQVDSPLQNIHLAMKANKWAAQSHAGTSTPPADIREIVKLKENYGGDFGESRPRNSSKSSLVNYNEGEGSAGHTPQFSLTDKIASELSFGRVREREASWDVNIAKGYFEQIMERMEGMDERIMGRMEGLEKRLGNLEKKQRGGEREGSEKVSSVVEELRGRVEGVEKKINKRMLAEGSLRNAESMKFNGKEEIEALEQSYKYIDQSNSKLEESVKQLVRRIKAIEQRTTESTIDKSLLNKFTHFEDRLSQIEKVSDNFSHLHKNYSHTMTKVKKLEEIMGSCQSTPVKKQEKSGFFSPSILTTPSNQKPKINVGEECESIILGALLDRVNHSFRSSPERPVSAMSVKSSYQRAPSTDLKESLRLKGFMVDGGKPMMSASSFKRNYKNP